MATQARNMLHLFHKPALLSWLIAVLDTLTCLRSGTVSSCAICVATLSHICTLTCSHASPKIWLPVQHAFILLSTRKLTMPCIGLEMIIGPLWCKWQTEACLNESDKPNRYGLTHPGDNQHSFQNKFCSHVNASACKQRLACWEQQSMSTEWPWSRICLVKILGLAGNSFQMQFKSSFLA